MMVFSILYVNRLSEKEAAGLRRRTG